MENPVEKKPKPVKKIKKRRRESKEMRSLCYLLKKMEIQPKKPFGALMAKRGFRMMIHLPTCVVGM